MAVLAEVLWVARLLGGLTTRRRRRYAIRHESPTRQESRELAALMRRLPVRFADRIGPRLQQKITEAAAAGEWERAVEQLIVALCTRSVPVSQDERDELRSALRALRMPDDAVAALAGGPNERPGGAATRPVPAT